MAWIGPGNADAVTVPDTVGLTVGQAREVARDPAPGSRARRRGSLVVAFRELPGGRAGFRP
ncbi:hypothetical protein ACFV4M_23145 [Kitasatospora indigofera]|uniref:hypothetical protein n=1 Tax=Kitasatospora indigofera TaxID=67307 RepID=UPI0036655F19